MEKVICDICGTTYPESEECCPVCGSFQDLEFNFDLEMEDDDFLKDSPITASKIQKQEEALEAFLEEPEDEDDPDEEEEYGEEEGPRRGKTGVVILLIILIMILLGACGFLFLCYVMPNMNSGDVVPKETQTEAPVETTTEPGIPCQQLILTSGGTVELTREGEYKLINVIVKPEDTTDKVTYTSSDEAVVTVNEEGRITGVGEGEAVVTIVCGEQKIDCRVQVQFAAETEPPTEEATVPVTEETEAAAETQAPTEAEETKSAETVPETQAQLKDVTLKLKKTDFSMGVGYQYTIPLDCDLEYSEIEWSTGNAGIAVIEDGVISTLSKGTTQMFAKYGDQVVTGWIRVK